MLQLVHTRCSTVTMCYTVYKMGKYSNVIPSITGSSPIVRSNGSSRVVFVFFFNIEHCLTKLSSSVFKMHVMSKIKMIENLESSSE